MEWKEDFERISTGFDAGKYVDCYIAKGKFGTFKIWFNGRFFHGKYEGDFCDFRLPRQKTLEEMKALCESNSWWEAN